MAKTATITQESGIFRAKDKVLQFTVLGSDGLAHDITDMTFSYGWYKESNGDVNEPVFTVKTLGSGVTVIDAAAGVVQVLLTGADLTITAGKYTHELVGTDDDLTDVLAEGTVVLRPSPTE